MRVRVRVGVSAHPQPLNLTLQVARLSAAEFRAATMLPGYHPSQVARLSAEEFVEAHAQRRHFRRLETA